ncbi:MAG: ComEC/Rec2 family competence protein, partial [Anaerolineales bacterium]
SFLVNPLILPAQPPVMVASGLAVLAGIIYLPLGKILAWLAWPFSMYTIRIVELFNKIPKGTIYLGEFSFLFVVIFYLVLFGITFIPKSLKKTIRSQIKPSILIGVLVLSTILVWKAVITLPDGKLHVNFFNVENGNAILIQTASGKNLLINGGSSRSELSDALGRRLSPFDRHLDALIIASTLENQLTALPGTIQQYPPDLVLWSGLTALSDSATQLRRDLETSGIPIIQSDTGMVMDLGDGAFLDILTVNSHGMVLMLKWNEFTALLPIEMDFDNLSNLLKDPELDNVSLYLVSSSGYLPLNPIEWIDKLNPNLGILTVSSSDTLLLPDQETMIALEPYPILRTDYNGWIKVSTDGNQIWVESER